MTAELVQKPCTKKRARELTRNLKTSAASFFEALEAAFTEGAHTALGYTTFKAYLSEEFPTLTPPRIPKTERDRVIGRLLEAGMSTREAAAATGVAQKTAARVRTPEPPPPPAEVTVESVLQEARTVVEDLLKLHSSGVDVADLVRELRDDIEQIYAEATRPPVVKAAPRKVTSAKQRAGFRAAQEELDAREPADEFVITLGTDHGLKGTDWSRYGACPVCLVDPGQICRHETPNKGEGGLISGGRRPLRNPHKGRPKIR